MSNNPDENYPIERPVIDLSTSCTIDDAVSLLLGFKQGGAIREYSSQDDPALDNYFNWSDFLLSERESAEIEYANSKVEKCSPEIITKKLEALKNADLNITKAHRLKCELIDALAKGELTATKETANAPRITLVSLDAWAKDNYAEYKNSCFKDALPSPHSDSPSATLVAASINAQKRCLTKNQVIGAFKDLHFNEEQWDKYLASPPDWLETCRVTKGVRGDNTTSATWDPVLIAIALFDRKVPLRDLDAVFVRLKDWADEWEEKSSTFR